MSTRMLQISTISWCIIDMLLRNMVGERLVACDEI